MQEAEYLPLPQPEELTQREKDDAMGAYLMMFAAWGVGLPLPGINILAAVIYYFVNRGKGRFVKFHAHQSMTSQIIVGVTNASVIFWLIRMAIADATPGRYFFSYLAVAVLINLLYFAFSIWGAVRARKGRFVYFWFFGKLAYHYAYRRPRSGDPTEETPNMPPSGM